VRGEKRAWYLYIPWQGKFRMAGPMGMYKYHAFFSPLTLFKPLKMDPTEGSETSANINQTLGIHPKVETVNTGHSESLKSRTSILTTNSPYRSLSARQLSEHPVYLTLYCKNTMWMPHLRTVVEVCIFV
jgi:hypothetical protein